MMSIILSGAVLACGALLVLAGAAKLFRAVRRAGSGGAIRTALRISPRNWRWIEPAAGLAEAATGMAVCAGFHPAAAGTALAVQGALFSGLLAHARRVKAPGGCACVRSTDDRNAVIGWPVQARAAWLLTAGVIEAVVRLPRPTPTTGPGVAVGLAALGALVLMLGAEETWRTPRCRRPIWLPRRRTVKALMGHGVFGAMANAVGPFTEGFSYHRDGCVDEFRFAVVPRAGRTGRAVAFRVSRTAHGGTVAVEARIEAVGGY